MPARLGTTHALINDPDYLAVDPLIALFARFREEHRADLCAIQAAETLHELALREPGTVAQRHRHLRALDTSKLVAQHRIETQFDRLVELMERLPAVAGHRTSGREHDVAEAA